MPPYKPESRKTDDTALFIIAERVGYTLW